MGILTEEQRAQAEGLPQAAPPLLEAEVVRHAEFGMPDGTVLAGAFTFRVFSLADRAAMARTRAVLCGGLPWESFGPDDQVLLGAMARCEVLFGKRPGEPDRAPAWWYTTGPAKMGAHVVLALENVHIEHENQFFRAGPGASPGAAGRCYAKVLPADGRADRAAG